MSHNRLPSALRGLFCLLLTLFWAWRSVADDPTITLPQVLHECDVNCNTLRLYNGNYVLVTRYRWDRYPGPIIWKVESWTRQAVKLHRTYPEDQIFGGQMSPTADSLINVTLNGTPNNGIRIAWGNAINTVFGSNEERDRASLSGVAAQGVPSSQAGITDEQWKVCRSSKVRKAMQNVEDQQAGSLFGRLAPNLPCMTIGVCPETTGHPQILVSRPATDGAGYTKNEPSSFICQGLFTRGKLDLTTRSGNDLEAALTTTQMNDLLNRFPTFQEGFKVRPLGNGRYLLILIPSIGGLPRYSVPFDYP